MTAEEAIARARAALALGAGVATARPVARLDGLGGYWLVSIDDDARTLAVAAIAEDGDVVGSGRPVDAGRLPAIDEVRARALAGAPASAACRLVWFASRASQSPLFPLWEVARGGAAVWVAMDGTVYAQRPEEGRGG